jgi:hypothetical protein
MCETAIVQEVVLISVALLLSNGFVLPSAV